jgi:chromosome partitioning protein
MSSGQEPKILVVAQQKGGVGKTTLSRMLGIFGAREDLLSKRVLMLDLDYQASLSKLALTMEYSRAAGTIPPIHPAYKPGEDDWDGRSSSADIFFDGVVFPYPVQHPYKVPRLEILPAHKARLQMVEEQDRTQLREKVHNRLHEFFALPEVAENYDLVIIDTGPKESPLVRTALRAATHMIVPVTMETQCIDGLSEMMSLWNTERASRPATRPLIMAGLLVNRFDARYNMHRIYLSQLQNDPRLSVFLCSEVLPQRAAVTERDARGAKPATLFDLPRAAEIREIALEVCRDIFSKVFPDEADRMTKLQPDPKFLSMVEAAEREAGAEQDSPGAEDAAVGGQL